MQVMANGGPGDWRSRLVARAFRAAGLLQIAALAMFALNGCAGKPDVPRSTLIANATLIDGTGAPPRAAAVRVVGERIAAVGDLQVEPGEELVDARGLVLAPGFIDTHSHADIGLWEHRGALASVSQGITSAIVGQDGGSPYPLEAFFDRLEREAVAINVGSYAGFGTLRSEVLGEDFRRPATPDEIGRMRALLREEMGAGALGLGTGLEYDPGIYSSPDEVVAMAREAAAHGGRYMSHVRSEDRWFWEAVEEILNIGRQAQLPVQISHIKLALRSNHGQADRLIEILDEAREAGIDVTADIYPYTYWQSTLTVMFPDRDFENLETARFALSELTTPEGAYLGDFAPNPEYEGKTLREVAELRGIDPATALVELIRESLAYQEQTGEEDVESVIAIGMDEADVERLMLWPHANLGTDGDLDGAHPRGFGSYPRFLGRYVRERGLMDLATAVHKSSDLAAAHVGIRDRGLIRPGMFADLVLFDAERIIDRATPQEPHAVSVGIHRVWVNGEVVFADGRTTGRLPGRVIRRAQAVEAP
jgi:N-acyl-D-amino-acid deacylase